MGWFKRFRKIKIRIKPKRIVHKLVKVPDKIFNRAVHLSAMPIRWVSRGLNDAGNFVSHSFSAVATTVGKTFGSLVRGISKASGVGNFITLIIVVGAALVVVKIIKGGKS
jgi:hypothetical protein